MRFAQRLLVIALLLSLTGCATIRISTQYNPKATFSDLKTYAWIVSPEGATGDPRLDNPKLHSEIRQAVERRLLAQGYEKKESGTPDFWVGYHAAIERKESVRAINESSGYAPAEGWRTGPIGFDQPETTVYEYEEGSLILDISNPATRKLLWRGSAQAKVDRYTSDQKRQRRINTAVKKILSQFPPH